MSTPANALDITQAGLVKFDGVSNFTGVTTTQFDVLGGAASNGITNIGPGSSGQILQSGGAAANPSYSTATYPSTAGANGNVLTSDGTNWLSSTPASHTAGYAFNMGTLGSANPVASTTYFLQNTQLLVNSSASGAGLQKMYIPIAGTLKSVNGSFHVGVTGSSENATLNIRVNNTTNATVSSTLAFNVAPVNFSNTGMSQSLSVGDYIEVVFITPAWVTPPTGVWIYITIFVAT